MIKSSILPCEPVTILSRYIHLHSYCTYPILIRLKLPRSTNKRIWRLKLNNEYIFKNQGYYKGKIFYNSWHLNSIIWLYLTEVFCGREKKDDVEYFYLWSCQSCKLQCWTDEGKKPGRWEYLYYFITNSTPLTSLPRIAVVISNNISLYMMFFIIFFSLCTVFYFHRYFYC